MSMTKIKPIPHKLFISYPYLVAIMAVFQVLSTIYGRKFTTILGFNIAIGPLVFLPLVLYTFQIASECYGWQYSRQLAWSNFVVNGIVTLATLLVSYINISPLTHEHLRHAYVHLVDTMWISALVLWICIFISDFVVSWLMCQAKLKFKGRFLIVRVIILHLVLELIAASGMFIALYYNNYSWYQSVRIFINTMLIRTIMSALLLPLVKLIIWFIQHKIEHVVVFDYKMDFNVLKFKIDPRSTVQFNIASWKNANRNIRNLER